MGTSVQSQAISHQEKRPKKSPEGKPRTTVVKKLGTKTKSKKTPVSKIKKIEEDLDEDYKDDNIPNESEITKKFDYNSSRFKIKKFEYLNVQFFTLDLKTSSLMIMLSQTTKLEKQIMMSKSQKLLKNARSQICSIKLWEP